jgi:predicted nucleic acid-binding protein
MVVVDTNIIVPLYVRSARTAAAATLRERDGVWRTEPFALVEFSNVLINYRRAQYLSSSAARDCLVQAEMFLQPHYFAVAHEVALEFALRYNVTAYDARFLALAQQLGTALVTEDAKLRAGAPALTQSLAEALARA